MEIITDWMSHFTERINTEKGFLNFYFNKLYTINGTRYHVSVIDNKRKVHVFQLYKENLAWKILNKENYPYWIVDLEFVINETIKKVH